MLRLDLAIAELHQDQLRVEAVIRDQCSEFRHRVRTASRSVEGAEQAHVGLTLERFRPCAEDIVRHHAEARIQEPQCIRHRQNTVELGRGHARDGHRRAVYDMQELASDVRVGGIGFAPQPVTEDDGRLPFGMRGQTANCGLHAEGGEEISRYANHWRLTDCPV